VIEVEEGNSREGEARKWMLSECEALESKTGNGSRGLAEARGSRLSCSSSSYYSLHSTLPRLHTYKANIDAFLLNACALLDASKPAVSSLVKGLARIAATRNLPPSCTTAACSTGTARKTNNRQK
jgi:hypothetical protein